MTEAMSARAEQNKSVSNVLQSLSEFWLNQTPQATMTQHAPLILPQAVKDTASEKVNFLTFSVSSLCATEHTKTKTVNRAKRFQSVQFNNRQSAF